MHSRRSLSGLSAAALLLVTAFPSRAQQQQPPAQSERDGQEVEKVNVEEVRVPVFAADEHGNFDPTLERDDVLVLEDDVPQEVRSVVRVPASILLLLGTGGELNPAVRTSTTRDIALQLVSRLREGDRIALAQFNSNVQRLQDWTEDKRAVLHTLRTKLSAGRGSRLSKAVVEASAYFETQPVGNRHLVLITDGVEVPGRLSYQEAIKVLGAETPEARAQAAEAVRRLNAAQATVHVISYTSIGRKALEVAEKRDKSDVVGAVQSRADMATVGIDPTRPPGMRGSGINAPSVGVGVRFDPQMRKLRKAYERETKRSEQRLLSLAEETGGRVWLPITADEMVAAGGHVAREIGSQYVITYRPKRPLADSQPNEYRRLRVAPRRVGLTLRARRGYVVAAMR
ncbi:MAG TPA: VWA domain-containing protein [Pyrinomonadaceae bacterium]|nr:VWA domain-containing protein [Pyrinomonadaceae bacterium]